MRTHVEDQPAETVEQLQRRVAWQVAAAYGLPLPEPTPEPAVAMPTPEPSSAAEHIAPEREPEVQPEPDPAREGRPPRVLRLPTLDELERLVAAAEAAEPQQAEQWQWMLFYLRDYSEVDGRLPECFAPLVASAFAPLL